MKPFTRHILLAISITVMLAYISTFLGISAKKRSEAVCTGLKVCITDSARNSFVTSEEICRYISSELGEVTGRPLGEVDLTHIETLVDARSAVLKSEAFVTGDGYLNINVTQREPVIRFQGRDGGFYVDRDGYIFPLQSSFTSDVTIIDGYIPVHLPSGYKGMAEKEDDREWIDGIMEMVGYMDDGIWADIIVQISVGRDGDIIMVPRSGGEKFIFGDTGNFEDKFCRMEKYYTAIRLARKDAGYSYVNVKYDGQIICRR